MSDSRRPIRASWRVTPCLLWTLVASLVLQAGAEAQVRPDGDPLDLAIGLPAPGYTSRFVETVGVSETEVMGVAYSLRQDFGISTGIDVFVQRIDPPSQAISLLSEATPVAIFHPAISVSPNRRFRAVAFVSLPAAAKTTVRKAEVSLRIFDGESMVGAVDVPITSATGSNVLWSTAAPLVDDSGRVLLAYDDMEPEPRVRFRRFAQDGAPIGEPGELPGSGSSAVQLAWLDEGGTRAVGVLQRWGVEVAQIDLGPGGVTPLETQHLNRYDQRTHGWPSVASSPSTGAYVVAWSSRDAFTERVHARRFAPDGRSWIDFEIASDLESRALHARVAMDKQGQIAAAWQHNDFGGEREGSTDIWVRGFDALGRPLGDAVRLNEETRWDRAFRGRVFTIPSTEEEPGHPTPEAEPDPGTQPSAVGPVRVVGQQVEPEAQLFLDPRVFQVEPLDDAEALTFTSIAVESTVRVAGDTRIEVTRQNLEEPSDRSLVEIANPRHRTRSPILAVSPNRRYQAYAWASPAGTFDRWQLTILEAGTVVSTAWFTSPDGRTASSQVSSSTTGLLVDDQGRVLLAHDQRPGSSTEVVVRRFAREGRELGRTTLRLGDTRFAGPVLGWLSGDGRRAVLAVNSGRGVEAFPLSLEGKEIEVGPREVVFPSVHETAELRVVANPDARRFAVLVESPLRTVTDRRAGVVRRYSDDLVPLGPPMPLPAREGFSDSFAVAAMDNEGRLQLAWARDNLEPDPARRRVDVVVLGIDAEGAPIGQPASLRSESSADIMGLPYVALMPAARDRLPGEPTPVLVSWVAALGPYQPNTFGYRAQVVEFPGEVDTCGGVAGLCLGEGRFLVEVDWQTAQGSTGSAQQVAGGTEDSGVLWFFSPSNWEMMVKVLDGCGVNGHFWVLAAATTDVGYQLRVTDTETGEVRTYDNPVGRLAEATTDTTAFDTCGDASRPAPEVVWSSRSQRRSAALDLAGGRFRATVEWRDFRGDTGQGGVAWLRSADSGIFYFFDASNWELLVKTVDGCALNGHHWLAVAATTDVEYTLTVTDTVSGEERVYFNQLGRASPAVVDTEAFAHCP